MSTNSAIKQTFQSLYRMSGTSNQTTLIHDNFPSVATNSMSHPSAAVAAASLFGHPSIGTGYTFPSLMAAVASSGVGNGDISTPGSLIQSNVTGGFQQGSPITPVPFRLGEFPFPGGLAAFRKLNYFLISKGS